MAKITSTERLEKRKKIRERLNQLQNEFRPVAFQKGELEKAVRNAEARLKNYRSPQQNKVGHLQPDDQREQLTKEVERAKKELEPVTASYEQFEKEISSLSSELKNCFVVSEEELITWQNQAVSCGQEITRLNDAIADQEGIIRNAKQISNPRLNLQKEREKLLADIALEEASQDELKKLDSKIAKQEKNRKEDEANERAVVGPAEQTIAGLKFKLTTAKNKLATIEEEGRELFSAFLVSEAERLGEKYVSLVKQLTPCFSRLIALSRLLDNTQEQKIRGIKWEVLQIPMFHVQACGDAGEVQKDGFLFSAESRDAEEQYVISKKDEIGRILGIAPDIGFAIQ